MELGSASPRAVSLHSLGIREDCVAGVSFLVSTAPMVHDAVAHHGRFVVGPRGTLMVEGDGHLTGTFVVVLEAGSTFASGRVVSPHGSVVPVGEWFFFDRGCSPQWTSEQVLSLVHAPEALGALGIGL